MKMTKELIEQRKAEAAIGNKPYRKKRSLKISLSVVSDYNNRTDFNSHQRNGNYRRCLHNTIEHQEALEYKRINKSFKISLS